MTIIINLSLLFYLFLFQELINLQLKKNKKRIFILKKTKTST